MQAIGVAAHQTALDTRALEIAVRTQERQETHEQQCTERWREVKGWLKWVMTTVLAGLGGIIALLVNMIHAH